MINTRRINSAYLAKEAANIHFSGQGHLNPYIGAISTAFHGLPGSSFEAASGVGSISSGAHSSWMAGAGWPTATPTTAAGQHSVLGNFPAGSAPPPTAPPMGAVAGGPPNVSEFSQKWLYNPVAWLFGKQPHPGNTPTSGHPIPGSPEHLKAVADLAKQTEVLGITKEHIDAYNNLHKTPEGSQGFFGKYVLPTLATAGVTGIMGGAKHLYNTKINKKQYAAAMKNPLIRGMVNMSGQLGAVGMDPSQANTLAGLLNKPSFMQKAVVYPLVGAGSALAAGYAANKLKDLSVMTGFSDPITNTAVRMGVSRASANDPELNSIDPKLLHNRGLMLYHTSPDLFHPHNKEALRNTLLRIKDMGGPDSSVLKEIGELQKVISGNKVKTEDYYDQGSNIFGK